MKRFLPIFLATLSLSGCLGVLLTPSYTPELHWKEEVKLHDGRVIVAERERRQGGRAEPGQAPPQNWEEIRARNPDTGEDVVWQDESGTAAYVLDFVGGVPYLASRVGLFRDCKKYRFPELSFVFFKYQAGSWERIDLEKFPATLDTNLLLGSWHAEAIGMLSSFMTLEKKAAYYKQYGPRESSIRKILVDKQYQNPCARFSYTRDYLNKDK
jgi:hypothetical protein